MIEIELDGSQPGPGELCRGRARLRFEGGMEAKRVTATLRAYQTIEKPFSSEPRVRQIKHEGTMEIGGASSYAERELTFELRVPHEDELATFPEPPAFLKRLVAWIAPDAVQPVRWELEVRLERPWKKDVTAILPLDAESSATSKRRAS